MALSARQIICANAFDFRYVVASLGGHNEFAQLCLSPGVKSVYAAQPHTLSGSLSWGCLCLLHWLRIRTVVNDLVIVEEGGNRHL